MNTPGFHGPMMRYTPEESRKFLEEEAKRDAEESAAYFAWKRGETPLGSQPPKYTPPNPENHGPESLPKNDEKQHLFDDPLFDDDSRPQPSPREEHGVSSDAVDIDSVDVDDLSPKGRDRRMRAMAEELHGFSASQRMEALMAENERLESAASQGRRAVDHFGQRFDRPSKR